MSASGKYSHKGWAGTGITCLLLRVVSQHRKHGFALPSRFYNSVVQRIGGASQLAHFRHVECKELPRGHHVDQEPCFQQAWILHISTARSDAKMPCHLGSTICLGGGGGKELLSCHRDNKVKNFGTCAASLLTRHEIAATGEVQHAQPARGVLGSCVITIPSSHMTRRPLNVTCCMCETASPLVAQRCEVSPIAAARLTDDSAATLD